MRNTPVSLLISAISGKWFYKNSHFYYPLEFGIENEEIADEYGEYWCSVIEVSKSHSYKIKHKDLQFLFDAVEVDINQFQFLHSIEAKHKLLY